MADHEFLKRDEELEIDFAARRAHAEELLTKGMHPFEVVDTLIELSSVKESREAGSTLTGDVVAFDEQLNERVANLVYKEGYTPDQARKILYLSIILHSGSAEA
jgi:hypothetical protein